MSRLKNVIPPQTEADALINLETAFNDVVKTRCSDCRFCKMAITGDNGEIAYLCCRRASNNFMIRNAYIQFACDGFKDCGMIARYLREKAWTKYAKEIDRLNKEGANNGWAN